MSETYETSLLKGRKGYQSSRERKPRGGIQWETKGDTIRRRRFLRGFFEQKSGGGRGRR